MRKFLSTIFFIVLCIALVYKSPFSAMYNYNKGKELYTNGKYEQSLPYFERSLFASPKGILARFYYVLALSKSKPTYTIQKKLYDMANSQIQDEAQKYAKAQAITLRYELLEGVSNNFIYNAAMGNDILRWDIKSFPLKVYIASPQDVPQYYIDAIRKALKLWTIRTNFVKFEETDNESDSNIAIKFKKIPSDICKNDICTYTVAYTEPKIDSNKLLKRMNLTFYKTNPYNKGFSEQEVFNTALHEIGHTLGIMGHSENPNDAMFALKEDSFWAQFRSVYNSLSMRDLRTLALLYRIEPTISDTKDLHSENFYYAPLILGNNDIRLQKKLEEYMDYTRKYPHLAAGYINMASVYTDLGDYKSALEQLKTAESIASTSDEKFIIYHNLAIIYYNKQDYTKALNNANKAKAIKNDENINDLISEIKKLQ